jgi:hypothetical protein
MPEPQWNSLRDRVLQKVLNIADDEVLNHTSMLHTIPVELTNSSVGLQKVLQKLLEIGHPTPSGNIDYKAIKKDNTFQFDFVPLTNQLKYFNPASLTTRAERLAFWINLYNAMILHAVIANNIQESVNEGKWGAAAFFQKAAYEVYQERVSADDIEHGILRANQGQLLMPGKQFALEDTRHAWVIFPMEPRIHFALHCASKSSPFFQVYHPETLDKQLDQAVCHFLRRETEINGKDIVLLLPNLLKGIQHDLGGQDKILEMLMEALPEESNLLRQYFERWKIKYKAYDWALNQS